jgi:prepilin-type N-terminal cleavage/methylation domain-containing protein
MKKKKKLVRRQGGKKGFTLIELLIVIAIIGILASVVMLSLQSARSRSQEASAISSSKNALTLLAECKNDEGEALASDPANDGTSLLCCEDDTCAAAKAEHETEYWPSIASTGYAFVYTSGTVDGGDYIFQLTKTGQDPVTCSMVTNNCE